LRCGIAAESGKRNNKNAPCGERDGKKIKNDEKKRGDLFMLGRGGGWPEELTSSTQNRGGGWEGINRNQELLSAACKGGNRYDDVELLLFNQK